MGYDVTSERFLVLDAPGGDRGDPASAANESEVRLLSITLDGQVAVHGTFERPTGAEELSYTLATTPWGQGILTVSGLERGTLVVRLWVGDSGIYCEGQSTTDPIEPGVAPRVTAGGVSLMTDDGEGPELVGVRYGELTPIPPEELGDLL